MKAMLFAAGLGTRLKPFTNNHPKALAVVNKKPLLQRNLEYLKHFGINDVVINVHHFADQIISFLKEHDNFGMNIQISDETDEVLETGGGLQKAKDLLGDDDFLVMNVDILTDLNLTELVAFHQNNQPLVTLAVSDRVSSRKLLFNKNNHLKGWKNLKTEESIICDELANHELAFSGVHIINPKIFSLMARQGKFSIMKTYMDLMKNEIIIGYNHTGGILIDVGKPESIIEAERNFS